MSFFSLEGKVALVTGGLSGIGAAVVARFREAGARVFVADRLEGGDFTCDVAEEASVAAAIDGVVAATGRLDIMVNNAGIQPLGVGFEDLGAELLARTLQVNVHGVAFGIKHAARVMERGGRVLNTGSFVGLIGVPGGAAYATSKAAVSQLTRLGALELAPRGITVNAVCPGTIRTPAVTGIADNPEIPFVEEATPLGRLGEPGEVAAAFHFLASEDAGYITGVNLPVDGGIVAGWERYELTPPEQVRDGGWVE